MAAALRTVVLTRADAAGLARKAAVLTGTVFRELIAFLELLTVFLLDCLGDVVAPCSSVAAAAASTVRDRRMAWRLRCKQTLFYMRFRIEAETNILPHVSAPGQVKPHS